MEEDYIAKLEAVQDLLDIRYLIKGMLEKAKEELKRYEEMAKETGSDYYKDEAKRNRIMIYCLQSQLDKMLFEFFDCGAIPPDFDAEGEVKRDNFKALERDVA